MSARKRVDPSACAGLEGDGGCPNKVKPPRVRCRDCAELLRAQGYDISECCGTYCSCTGDGDVYCKSCYGDPGVHVETVTLDLSDLDLEEPS